MPFTYRGPGPWGAGTGAPLTQPQFDGNTYEAQTRIEALEAAIAAFGGVIDSITLSGTTLTFHLVGGAEHDVTLPLPRPNRVEAWQPNTFYVPWDFVSHNGSVYIVLYAHQSGAEFDPGANNGQGQDYYGLFYAAPELAVPEGGLAGQFLAKASNDDFDMLWRFPDLAGLADVEIDEPAAGHLLKWNAGNEAWVNAPAAFAELSGALTTAQFPPTVTEINDAAGDVTLDVTAGTIFKITAVDDVTLHVNAFRAGAPLVLFFHPTTSVHTVTFDQDSFVSAGPQDTWTGFAFSSSFWCDGSRFLEASRLGPIWV